MLLHVYIYSYICYFWICKQCPFQVGKPRYNTICFLSASITLDVQTQCQVLQFANHNLQVLVMFYLICLHICKIHIPFDDGNQMQNIFSNLLGCIYLWVQRILLLQLLSLSLLQLFSPLFSQDFTTVCICCKTLG